MKHKGIDYIVDNFKNSRIIGVTNMIVEETSNIHVCKNKILIKCRDRLHITCEVLQSPTPRIVSQVQDSWASFRHNFSKDMYDEGIP